MADHNTPEGRLEGFIAALLANDLTLIPDPYILSEEPAPMIADLRDVLDRLRAAEAKHAPS